MTRPRKSREPRDALSFYCAVCYHTWRAPPARVEEVEDWEAQREHRYRYTANCPRCDAECEPTEQEQALMRAWARATGPRTPEGLAATAKNLEGHPTPEEAQRTRFNGMKHGLSARTATYFPAKPDGYAFCRTCTVDRVWCSRQAACLTQTQRFMLHHAAFEQRDPKVLSELHADMQAAIFTLVQQILQTIIADGVKLESPEWFHDKDGVVQLAQYIEHRTGEPKTIMKIEAHPLFKSLAELLTRNNLSLADLGMTPRVIEGEGEQLGRLAQDGADQESLTEYQRRNTAALEALVAKLDLSRDATERDPVLIEYQSEQAE